MKTFIAPIVTFSIAIFLMSCASQRSQVWEPYERSGLGEVDTRPDNKPPSTNLVHRLIPVSLIRRTREHETLTCIILFECPLQEKQQRQSFTVPVGREKLSRDRCLAPRLPIF